MHRRICLSVASAFKTREIKDDTSFAAYLVPVANGALIDQKKLGLMLTVSRVSIRVSLVVAAA